VGKVGGVVRGVPPKGVDKTAVPGASVDRVGKGEAQTTPSKETPGPGGGDRKKTEIQPLTARRGGGRGVQRGIAKNV